MERFTREHIVWLAHNETQLILDALTTDDLPEGATNLYYTEVRVTSNVSVAANTAHSTGDGSDHSEVATNVTHRGRTDNPHSVDYTQTGAAPASHPHFAADITDFDIEVANNTDVAANTTHRASDGTSHSHVVLNDAHRAGDGTDHLNVVLNDAHRASDGTDHSNVVLNDAHRATVTGNPHDVLATQISDFDTEVSNNTDVAANTAHRTSDGTDHSNVVLNDTHRLGDGSDHADVAANTAHAATTTGNPHQVTFTESVAQDAGTDILAAEAETLTDGSNADLLHLHDHGALEGLTDADDHPQFRPKNGWALGATDTVTFSFNDGTRTFTISPVGVSFSYWCKGVEYTKATPQSVVIDDISGPWFITFDEGTLVASQTPWDIAEDVVVMVALIIWDAIDGNHHILGNEMHTWIMDPATHAAKHNTTGSLYSSGFLPGDLDVEGNGDDASAAQMSISGGTFYDEDIEHSIADGFPQTLAPVAQIPVFYRTGASGVWQKLPAEDSPIVGATAGTLPYYNEYTGVTWQLTEIGNNDYGIVHIFATNDVEEPIIAIMGQGDFGTLGDAQGAVPTEIGALQYGDLDALTPEFIPIASFIFQTSIAYDFATNPARARFRETDTGADFIDWRGASNSGTGAGGGVSNDHGTLAGLADDDHLQYHTDARGDLRYSQLGHSHVVLDITDFDAEVSSNVTVAANAAHAALTSGNPHSVTLGDVGGAAAVHSHITGDITDWATSDLTVNQLTSGTSVVATGVVVASNVRSNADAFLNYDGPDGDSRLYFYDGGSPTGRYLMWDDSAAEFYLSTGLFMNGPLEVNGRADITGLLDVTSFVRAETLYSESDVYLGYGGPDGNSYIYFYDGSSATGKYLAWDNNNSRFTFNSGLKISGDLELTNDTDHIPYVTKVLNSRGPDNLITNAGGDYGYNYNFSGLTWDPDEIYNEGGVASFSRSGNYTAVNNEPLPVNPALAYEMNYWTKSDGTGNQKQYGGVLCLDADGSSITPALTMRVSGTDTTLAADLNPGDTTVTLTDATSWKGKTGATGVPNYQRAFILYGYTNSFGHTYADYTYSRNHSGNGAWDDTGTEFSGNVLTLSTTAFPAGWTGAAYPAGTAISNASSGGNYKYISASNVTIATDWQYQSGLIGGVDLSGNNVTNEFHPGTAYVKVMWLMNYASTGVQWIFQPYFGPPAISLDNTGAVVGFDTDDVAEGSTNLYYTEARVSANTSVAANTAHAGSTANPHSVDKTDVGLSNVVNVKQIEVAANAITKDFSAGTVATDSILLYQSIAGTVRYTTVAAVLALGGFGSATKTKTIYIEDPTATDSFPIGTFSVASTLVSVSALTDTGTVTFNLEERSTPDTAGTDVFSTDQSATSAGASLTSFSNSSMTQSAWLHFAASAVGGGPTKVWLSIQYTED